MDKAALRALGVSEEMLCHLESDDIDRPFGYRCQRPYYWHSSPLASDGILALWECGTVVSYFNLSNGYFEQCSLESVDQVTCRYSSLQGLLAELFIDVYEDEAETEILVAYARLFGFLSIDRLLSEIESFKPDYDGWRRQFAISCC